LSGWAEARKDWHHEYCNYKRRQTWLLFWRIALPEPEPEDALPVVPYLDNAKLAEKTKSYHRNGWRLLEQTSIACMRLNHITAEDVDALPLPGGPYNINCALTLRRMLHKAEEWGLIAKVPKLKLMKELGRTLRLDQEAERKLLAAADSLLERGAWTRKMHDTLRDVVVPVRDTGMRNKKELYCARIEDIDWNNRVFFIPDSKTDNGRRFVPISDRALELLKARCGERREGWVFTAFSASGHLTTMGRKFREARREAGLPEKLVLYCGVTITEPGCCRGPAILPLSCAP
jgi:integrase